LSCGERLEPLVDVGVTDPLGLQTYRVLQDWRLQERNNCALQRRIERNISRSQLTMRLLNPWFERRIQSGGAGGIDRSHSIGDRRVPPVAPRIRVDAAGSIFNAEFC